MHVQIVLVVEDSFALLAVPVRLATVFFKANLMVEYLAATAYEAGMR